MMESLDLTKVHWQNCPNVLKGQLQGKEKIAGIGLEATADNNLWFWHASFGFPGSLKEINNWELLLLFNDVINGDHNLIDFDFLLNGETFSKFFL